MLFVHLVHAIDVNSSLTVEVEDPKQDEHHQLPLLIAYVVLANGTTTHFERQHRNLGFSLYSPLSLPLHIANHPSISSFFYLNISRMHSIFLFLAVTA